MGSKVDVEALHDRIPLRQIAEKGPKMDLTGIEACGGGKIFWWMPLMVWEYLGIYSAKIRVGRPPRGPQALREPPLGAPSRLVASSGTFWPPLQVL